MRIFDTDMLVAVLRKKEEALKKFEEIEKTEGAFFTTVFNVHELLYGALISENYEENFQTSNELIDSFQILLYDRESAFESVKAQIGLEKKGLRIGLIDEMIVGIALSKGASLVTRNTKHFSRIPGLKLEKW